MYVANRTIPYLKTTASRTVMALSTSAVVNGPAKPTITGDLNQTWAMRATKRPAVDPDFAYRSLAMSICHDVPQLRQQYRPFLLADDIAASDWISKLELSTVTRLASRDMEDSGERLRVLVLYGSLRKR